MTEETMIPMSEYLRVVERYTADHAAVERLTARLEAECRRSAEHWREVETQRELTQRAQAQLSAMTRQREAAGRVLTEALTELREAREEVERLRAAARWIPVSERLPERDETTGQEYSSVYVQAFCDNEFISPVWYAYENRGFVRGGKWYFRGEAIECITHWRPLPEPPTE